MGYYRRQQFRKQSEATEQERVIAWAAWNERQHPELKMLYHIPNGGSRNRKKIDREKQAKACFFPVRGAGSADSIFAKRTYVYREFSCL